ncbi:Ubiquinone biosynthesis O-methyltransferase [subsurface metagenome]
MGEVLKGLLELQPDLAPDRRVEYPWAIGKMTAPAEVLDVGCDGSIISKYLLNRGFNVIAADIDPNGRYYWNGEVRSNFALVDCRHPPSHWKNRFDYILIISTLEHLEDDNDVLMINNLTKCMKTGGKMFITGPYGDGWMEIGDHIERGYNEENLTRLSCGLHLVSTKLFAKEEMNWPWKDIFCIEFERGI